MIYGQIFDQKIRLKSWNVDMIANTSDTIIQAVIYKTIGNEQFQI